jgi:uroporphyrinogen-III synthase
MPSTGAAAFPRRSSRLRVLITRPREDFERTAALLAARGHQAVAAPLFRIQPLPIRIAGAFDAVLAASANALRQAEAADLAPLMDLPLFAVGAATAEAAREAGFRSVEAAQGDGAALAGLIRERMPAGSRLLHLAGRPRRDEAIAVLGRHCALVVAETYETVACRDLPPRAAEALHGGLVDAVLHFSPRAASVFGDLVEKAGLLAKAQVLRHVFISAAARDARFPDGRVAERPSLESVADAL